MISLKANIIRNDRKGSGEYGAPRGTRKHSGLDLLCLPGLPIYATEKLTFERYAKPYAHKPYSGGVWIDEKGYRVKIFYCTPVTVSKVFYPGDIIAHCDNIAKEYGAEMMPHVHVQVYDETGTIINPNYVLQIT